MVDWRGRKLMLLRALMGLISEYILKAMALVAFQVPRDKSGCWTLGALSTGQVFGVIISQLLGGFMADHLGLRVVFLITAGLMMISFLVTLLLIKESVLMVKKADQLPRSGGIRRTGLPVVNSDAVHHHHDNTVD